jgi:hypothetical protein
VLPNSEAVLPLLGQNLSGKGATLTRRAGASARTVAAYASAHLLQAIITHARARRHDGTVRRLRTVFGDATRRLGNRRAYRDVSLPAPCVSGRLYFLTWAHPAHLPAFNAVVGLESREGPSAVATWQDQPRTHRRGGTWRHRTRSRGGSGAVRTVEVWPPHVAAPDLPGESGSVGATRKHPCLHGHVEAPDL